MRNRFFLILILFILLISPVKKNEVKNLFLIFIAGDNDLYQNAIDDINELRNAIKLNSKIIIMFDGLHETKLIEMDDKKEVINSLNKNLNSGDPEVLYSLINYGFSKYYPDNTILILWGHGDGRNFKGGIHKGVCFDEDSMDYLTMQELKDVLTKTYKNFKRKLDVLVFDACFMQTIEVSYEFRNYVDFIIASQTYVPLDGFPYDDIFNTISKLNKRDISPQLIAYIIAESYYNSYNSGSQGKEEVQISVIKASETEKILSFLKDKIKELKVNDNSLLEKRKDYIIPLNNKYIDFFGFFKNYYPEIIDFIEELILVNKNSFNKELSGISFYFPEFYLPINLEFFKKSGFENILWVIYSY